MKNEILKIANKIAKGDNVTYSKHSTQFDFCESCDPDRLYYSVQKKIKDSDLYKELPLVNGKDDPNEEYGYETTPHVTTLYGLTEEEDYFDLRRKLSSYDPIEVELGDISSFRNDENPYDVLIIKIKSKQLHEIHEMIKKDYKNEYDYPEYQPHMTLAYVKSGKCKELEGKDHELKGNQFGIDMLKWSHKDKYYLDLPLGEK